MTKESLFRLFAVSARCACAAALAAAGAITAVAQETGSGKCPARASYTLEKVLKAVEDKAPEDAVAADIAACHVGFPLDANALDQLSKAGAPPAVMEALNRDTLLRLTRDQAHAEVAGMVQREQAIETEVNTERDAALRKLDADFQTRRERAASIAPKSQFESDADYNVRRRQNAAQLAQMDQAESALRAQTSAQYAQTIASRLQPFAARIAFLNGARYSDPRAAAFKAFDANAQRLTATIGGEDYIFESVPGKTAETLYNNWAQVRVEEPYDDDALHTRTIVLVSASITQSGGLSKAIAAAALNQALDQAKNCMLQGDFGCAAILFGRVLQRDPANQQASQGQSVVRELKEKQITFINGLQAAGIWLDGQTNLLWTISDSEKNVTWAEASDYCKTLRLDELVGWSLPTPTEFRGIYDPNAKARKFHKGLILFDNHYYLRGPFDLLGVWYWAANGAQFVPLTGDFHSGEVPETSADKYGTRALCVRRFVPNADGVDQAEIARLYPDIAAADASQTAGSDMSVISEASSAPVGVAHVAMNSYGAADQSSATCDAISTLRSPASTSPARMTFINRTQTLRQLFWLNFTGQSIRYTVLMPGTSTMQDSFMGHIWEVTDVAGRCIAVFRAGPGSLTEIIDR